MSETMVPRVSALVLLTVSLFLTFYLTDMAKIIVNALLHIIPPFLGLNEAVFILMFVAFAAIIGGIYTAGGKAKTTLLAIFSFLVLLLIAIPYSLNNWNSDQTNPYLTGGPQFFLTIATGITVLFCLLLINLISKLEFTQKELSTRGAQKKEIQTLTKGTLSYILPTTILSALLTTAALIIIMIARPLGIYVVELSPYMTLIFGVGSIATITLLLYYSLKQNNQTQTPQT